MIILLISGQVINDEGHYITMRTSLMIIFISIFLITTAFVVVSRTYDSFGDNTQSLSPPQTRDYRYHFVLIVQAPEESYWQQVYAGMNPLIQREKIGMEFYGPNLSDQREIQQILEMAILANCDGILLAVPNDPTFQSLITEAAARRIPVVALAYAPDSAALSFVGFSAYDLGFQTGKALEKAVSQPTAAALLVNSNFSTINNQQYLAGFKKAIRNNPLVRIGLIVNSKGESIQAEEQTQTIIQNHPEIQAIICSNPSDTLGVAKLVVDLNQVSRMTIIGAGLTSEIAGYIRRGVIQSVLADDPFALGAQGLATLLHFKNGFKGLETYHMPLYWVHSQNIDHYEQKFALLNPRDKR